MYCLYLIALGLLISLQNGLLADAGADYLTLMKESAPSLMEHVLISLALTFLLSQFNRMFLKVGILLAIFLYGLFLIVDQVYFGIFSSHINLTVSEGKLSGFNNIAGSFYSQLQWWHLLNFILLLLLVWRWSSLVLAATYRKLSQSKVRVVSWIAAFAPLLFVFFVPFAGSGPITTLLKSSNLWLGLTGNQAYGLDKSSTQLDIFEPLFGEYLESDSDHEALIAWKAYLQGEFEKKPNIVFIVLESVGSLQLIPDGKFDEQVTPFLNKISANSLVFDNLQASFPSTARSHIPLLTGGLVVTWGNVFKEYNLPYKGETLFGDYKKRGYQVGLFSAGDLSYENRYSFYKNLPIDALEGYNTLSYEQKKAQRLSSWGVNELFSWKRAFQWLKGDADKPFLIHYMTVATHHPYTYPDDLVVPFESGNSLSKYKNALYYTDTVIETIVADVKTLGREDNTILIVTGDHGQAFSQRHPRNRTHKNYIYEENLRSFLMIYPLSSNHDGLVNSRPASLHDIKPTLTDLHGDSPKTNNFSESLFEFREKPRPVFFHKNAAPAQWGVLDGQWKYIANIRGEKQQLFDLINDPAEQVNVIEKYPERIKPYTEAIENWYLSTDLEFKRYLQGFKVKGGKGLVAEDLDFPGPKIIAFGEREEGVFTEKDKVKSGDPLWVWTQWVPYTENKVIRYRWVSPSGEEDRHLFWVRPGWTRTTVKKHNGPPEEKGEWTLQLLENNKLLNQKKFYVY